MREELQTEGRERKKCVLRVQSAVALEWQHVELDSSTLDEGLASLMQKDRGGSRDGERLVTIWGRGGAEGSLTEERGSGTPKAGECRMCRDAGPRVGGRTQG